MMDATLRPPTPSSFTACDRCRSRKVKCDGQTPCCSACIKHGAQCDIVEHVVYSYETVRQLQDRIRDLEALLHNSASPANASQIASPPVVRSAPIDPSAEIAAVEVGNLTLGTTSRQYVGSAAGTSFARIFFHQLDLKLDGFSMSNFSEDDSNPIVGIQSSHASLPPKNIGQYLLSSYIVRIHAFWPLFQLATLRKWLLELYTSPQNCDSFQKYIIFMIFAIGSSAASNDPNYTRLLDIFQPIEYKRTASRFHDHTSGGCTLQNLQATLLLTIWMMRSHDKTETSGLWQVSRFAMSTAIELGCHRNNPRWNLTSAESEMRNRAWWSCYALERMIAVATGRTLSIRNHAIDAPFPCMTADDELTPLEKEISPTMAQYGFKPAIHMFRMRSIAGDILESVYIARPLAKGHQPQYPETMGVVDALTERLDIWGKGLEDHAPSYSREHFELKITMCLMVLLLNRPSPSSPEAEGEALSACYQASEAAIIAWEALVEQNQLVVTWLTFHDILLTGLTWLYCVWKFKSSDDPEFERFGDRIISLLQNVGRSDGSHIKSIKLFNATREATYQSCRSQSAMEINPPIRYISNNTNSIAATEWLDGYFNEIFHDRNSFMDEFNFSIDDRVNFENM